jgi:adenine-specific DNA-methyltransferase
MKELLDKNEIVFGEDETTQPQRKIFLEPDGEKPLSSIIYNGKKGKQELERLGFAFTYAHPTSLYEGIIDGTLDSETDTTLDFFAGSGTTAHTIINLNREHGGKRKYILVEMGEHFNTVILPRVKKVVFSDKWKDGKAQEGKGISHFCKYYELEQYEDTLRRASYQDAPLLQGVDPYTSYVFLRDLKLLDAITLDKKQNRVDAHLEQLYDGIDVAETLSCVTGKWIKRITREMVTFEDGTTASLTNPDWTLIKPLVWW